VSPAAAPGPRAASWDSEPQLWARTLRDRLRVGRGVALRRCRERTAMFDHAAAVFLNPAAPPPSVHVLITDLLARREAVHRWSLAHSALMFPVDGTWKLIAASVGATFLVLWLGVWAFAVFAAAVAPIAAAIPLELRRAARRARLLRCLREGTCCDCGYALAGTPDGIAGCPAGPRNCPECGCPWPLVPPPPPVRSPACERPSAAAC
jgi:hypothetical protein